MDPRGAALPRSRHIERMDVVPTQPLPHRIHLRRVIQIDGENRLAQRPGETEGQSRTAAQWAAMEDERPVTVPHVEAGAQGILGGIRLP